MGMFDTVNFTCPKCRRILEVQSKAGPCELNEITSHAVPAEIAVDILGKEVWCEQCQDGWFIEPVRQPIPTVHLQLAKGA